MVDEVTGCCWKAPLGAPELGAGQSSPNPNAGVGLEVADEPKPEGFPNEKLVEGVEDDAPRLNAMVVLCCVFFFAKSKSVFLSAKSSARFVGYTSTNYHEYYST